MEGWIGVGQDWWAQLQQTQQGQQRLGWWAQHAFHAQQDLGWSAASESDVA